MRRDLRAAVPATVPLLFCAGALANEFRSIGQRLPAPVAGVQEELAPTSQALASAAVSVKQDGAVFRASSVPLRAVDMAYIPVLSETKLAVSTDTSNNLTRPILSIAYNPFALRGSRGPGGTSAQAPEPPRESCAEVLNRDPRTLGCGERTFWSGCQLSAREKALEAAQKQHETASKDQAKAEDELLEGISHGEGALQRRKAEEVREKRARVAAATAAVESATRELEKAHKKFDGNAVQAEDECIAKELAAEWERLNSTWIPMVTLTGSLELYPGGKVPNPNDPTTTADLHAWGGAAVELGFLFHPSETVTAELYGAYRHSRSGGEPDAHFAKYVGGGLTASWLFAEFGNPADRYKSKDYIRDDFIPGFVGGLSVQALHCDGGARCIKGITDQWSVTPFVDLRIKPEIQLRLSLPIAYQYLVDTEGNTIAPTFTVAGAFSVR